MIFKFFIYLYVFIAKKIFLEQLQECENNLFSAFYRVADVIICED